MAEFCLDCWNKLNNENNTIYSCTLSDPDDLDLCEECGEYKQIFISYKRPSFFKHLQIRQQEKEKLKEK